MFHICNNVGLYFLCVSDDGKLSFEEFNAYFADGILTTEELQELFYSIDGRQNKWGFLFEMGSNLNPSWHPKWPIFSFFLFICTSAKLNSFTTVQLNVQEHEVIGI